MEAAGIEPASQDGPNDGRYMLSRGFVLERTADPQLPAARSSRLFLAGRPTAEPTGQIAREGLRHH